MIFNPSGIQNELFEGLTELAKHLGVELGEDGMPVCAEKCSDYGLSVICDGGRLTVKYAEKHHFFRAFGLAVQHLSKGETVFNVTEKAYFTMNGPMFDLSQAASAFNITELKSIIRRLALMGLNTLMLYTEDNYEVPSQPYFGYMRPRYTQEELKELDGYAYSLGIEMIPCIQTLSHLQEALKWKVYKDIISIPRLYA